MRWLIALSYDGSGFHGWQIQPNGRSVQGELEKALIGIAKTRIPIIGAGRTDTGVHAERQYAHFSLDTAMNERQMVLALQTQLTREIRVISAQIVPDDFSARYDAIRRTYRYDIATVRTPFNRLYASVFQRFRFIPERIPEYLPHFLGKHDFSAFAKHDNELENHLCDVKSIDFYPNGSLWSMRISADRYLHNMVRRIVGCAVFLSSHGLPPETIDALLLTKVSNQRLIATAPAEGLYLENVEYPETRLTRNAVLSKQEDSEKR
jgi:tRNA pseudouridine38-40 synthase